MQLCCRAYLFPCSLLIFSVVFSGWLGFYPEPSKPVIIFFSPFISSNEALDLARGVGARVIRLGFYSNSLVVQSDQPDFFVRLRQAGVWFMADATGIAGCSTKANVKQ